MQIVGAMNAPHKLLPSPLLTIFLEWVFLLDCDHLGQHGTEPLRVHEVQVTQETAVLVVEEDPVVMEEVSGLFQLLQLLIVASLVVLDCSAVGGGNLQCI